jgi:glycogen operon protein
MALVIDGQLHSLACTASCHTGNLLFYLIFNAYWEPLEFDLPPLGHGGAQWRRCIDTSLESPEDIVEGQSAPPVATPSYRAGARSVVVLFTPSRRSVTRYGHSR